MEFYAWYVKELVYFTDVFYIHKAFVRLPVSDTAADTSSWDVTLSELKANKNCLSNNCIGNICEKRNC